MDFRVVYGTGTRSFSSSRRLLSSSETLAIWRHVVLSPLGIGQPILTTLEQDSEGAWRQGRLPVDANRDAIPQRPGRPTRPHDVQRFLVFTDDERWNYSSAEKRNGVEARGTSLLSANISGM